MMASSPASTAGSSAGRRGAGRGQRARQRAGVGLVDVVAEHEVAQRGERVGGRRGGGDARAAAGPRGQRRQVDALLGDRCRGAASPAGSRRSSSVPPSTCVFAATSTSRTRPANGARSAVSSFMLSTTATMSPAATVSPAATGIATTIAGAGARTSPASPPEMRCTAPSTSTR